VAGRTDPPNWQTWRIVAVKTPATEVQCVAGGAKLPKAAAIVYLCRRTFAVQLNNVWQGQRGKRHFGPVHKLVHAPLGFSP
jgi:hypothetical protein